MSEPTMPTAPTAPDRATDSGAVQGVLLRQLRPLRGRGRSGAVQHARGNARAPGAVAQYRGTLNGWTALEASVLGSAAPRVAARGSHSSAASQGRDLETTGQNPLRVRETAFALGARWGEIAGGAP